MGWGGLSNNVFPLVPGLAKISMEPSCRGTNLTCSHAFFGDGIGDEFAESTLPCKAQRWLHMPGYTHMGP